MNSKCNQITDNDATQGIDFWQSTRKVLAVSESRFMKCGKTIDLTAEPGETSRDAK